MLKVYVLLTDWSVPALIPGTRKGFLCNLQFGLSHLESKKQADRLHTYFSNFEGQLRMHICTNLLLFSPKKNDSWVSLSKVILLKYT